MFDTAVPRDGTMVFDGIVKPEELYKFSTVARRFGGGFEKKVLVSTSISTKGEKAMYLCQRIKDIILIESDIIMDDKALKHRLKTILCD